MRNNNLYFSCVINKKNVKYFFNCDVIFKIIVKFKIIIINF